MIYVNDILYTNSSENTIDDIIKKVSAKYKTWVGSIKSKFLGMITEDVDNSIIIHSKVAVHKLLKHFYVSKCSPLAVPFLLGLEVWYKIVLNFQTTRYFRGSLSAFCTYQIQNDPKLRMRLTIQLDVYKILSKRPRTVPKQVLKYLHSTERFGVWYICNRLPVIVGHGDSSWAQERPN